MNILSERKHKREPYYQRAKTSCDTKNDRSAFVNRNPKTILRYLLDEQNVQQFNEISNRLKQAKNSKSIRFQSIPMTYKYQVHIPELDDYFKREDELQVKNSIDESKRKVMQCKNRLEQLKCKINDSILDEPEQQHSIGHSQQRQPSQHLSRKGKDYKYYAARMKTTINDTFQKKSRQADTFNQTLYFYIANRDQSLEEKSDRLNTTIQGQGFLDETQQLFRKSLHNQIKASQEQKTKFIDLIKDIAKRKQSIDLMDRKRLLRLRNSIAQGEYVNI